MIDPTMTEEELIERILVIRERKKALLDEEAVLCADLLELLGKTRERAYKGLAKVSVRSGTKSVQWDSARLLGVCIATAEEQRQPDPETGEIIGIKAAIEKMIAECAAIGYWRVTALDRHGIDASQFRTTEWGAKKVIIEPESPPPK